MSLIEEFLQDGLIFVWDEFCAHYGNKILPHSIGITGKGISCSTWNKYRVEFVMKAAGRVLRIVFIEPVDLVSRVGETGVGCYTRLIVKMLITQSVHDRKISFFYCKLLVLICCVKIVCIKSIIHVYYLQQLFFLRKWSWVNFSYHLYIIYRLTSLWYY